MDDVTASLAKLEARAMNSSLARKKVSHAVPAYMSACA